MPNRTCSVPFCEKVAKARGWCNGHYEHWRRLGTEPLPPCCPDCGMPRPRRGCCEPCMKGRRKARYNADPATAIAKTREWRVANPERRREQARKESSRFRERNPELHQARVADWRARNKEHQAAYRRAYREANPERARQWVRDRWARLHDAETCMFSLREWNRLIERYRGRCAYCDGPGPLTQEHVIPLSRGGRHAIGNLLPVCSQCNCKKNNRLLVEWRARNALGGPTHADS